LSLKLYIDPPSHHFLNDRLFVVEDGRMTGDRLNEPYAYLREYFNSKGMEVHTADFLPEAEAGEEKLYVSLGMVDKYKQVARRSDIVLSAFFAFECPIVEPSLYRDLAHAQRFFKRIFSWSDGPSLERFVGTRLACERFCWPQSFDDVHDEIWRRTHRKFLVMINSNKLPRVYWQELYTQRMRALAYFSNFGEVDLYGNGWSDPSWRLGKTRIPWTFRLAHYKLLKQWQRFYPDPLLQAARRVYRGVATSKSETLGQYIFALCFENMILKGWITEKIFDCFFAGTIPIYWGAPNIAEYVPDGCFIDMRRFSGFEELRDFLKSLDANRIQSYKDAARDFLRSPRFRPFSKQTFAELFARIIEGDTGLRL
jgi:hypothetical protein